MRGILMNPLKARILVGLGLIATLLIGAEPANREARVAIEHALPKLDGDHLKVSLVEVNYAPGASSKAHSHPCPVIGYVAEGSIRFQVKGEAEVVYKTGETFYEAPNGVHQVSANASDKLPAKLLAYFVCDHETPLSVPPPQSAGANE
jgi:quercetin dioxygenase-like cupin family protein